MFSHFTLDTHFTILFKFIKVHSITGVILTCVAFALLGILYEGIRCLRMNLAQKVSRNVSSNSCLSKMHAIQTLLHLFEISLGYALMLVVMTYNGWLFIANVIGLTIGLQLCVLYSKSHHMKPSTYQLKAQPSHSLNYHNDGATVRLAGEEVKDDRRTGSQQQTIKSVSHHSAGDEEIVETTQLVASV